MLWGTPRANRLPARVGHEPGLSIRPQQICPGGWGVGRHWGASTKLGVSGPTSLSIHPCPPWCQTPRMCLSLILRTTPKAGKKLDNSPKVTQPENGREPGVEARSVRLQKVLWTHGIQRCGPHTPGAYRSMEEKVRAMQGRVWEIPVKGWGPGGMGNPERRSLLKGRGETRTQFCLRLKPLGSALLQAASPSCRSLGRQGKCRLREQWPDKYKLVPCPSPPPQRPPGLQKEERRSQHHLQAPDIVWHPETFNPEMFHV